MIVEDMTNGRQFKVYKEGKNSKTTMSSSSTWHHDSRRQGSVSVRIARPNDRDLVVEELESWGYELAQAPKGKVDDT